MLYLNWLPKFRGPHRSASCVRGMYVLGNRATMKSLRLLNNVLVIFTYLVQAPVFGLLIDGDDGASRAVSRWVDLCNIIISSSGSK